MVKKKLFTYGILKPNFGGLRYTEYSVDGRPAVVNGYCLHIAGVAMAYKKEGGRVKGYLWNIDTLPDEEYVELLDALDALEAGYVRVVVDTPYGEAYMYVINREHGLGCHEEWGWPL